MVDTINKDKKLEQPCWECKLNNNLDVLFKKILSANLWILDDWGGNSHPATLTSEKQIHSALGA